MTVNTGEYSTLVAAIGSANEKYRGQITAGMYSDELFAEFQEKLKVAGVDEYVKLFHDAVDEFIS